MNTPRHSSVEYKCQYVSTIPHGLKIIKFLVRTWLYVQPKRNLIWSQTCVGDGCQVGRSDAPLGHSVAH